MTEILITSSALILALLLIRKVFSGSLSRRVQYALWALVLVRLLLPVQLPAMNFSVLTAAKPMEEQVTQQITEQPIYIPVAQAPLEEHPTARKVAPQHTLTEVGSSVWIAEAEQETAVEYKRLSPYTVLYWFWIAGSCAVGAFLLFANLRFWLWLRRVRTPYNVEHCKLRVFLVEAGLPSPCLFGLFRPAIYLTPGVLESETRLRHVIAHETTHARHLDHLWTFLRGVCLALYWFDPLVWVAAAAVKTDCELACDEGALARLDEEDRIPYGKTLLSLIPVRQTVNPLLAATAMSATKKHLKDRLMRIAKRSRQTAAVLVTVALLVAAVSACTFTGGNSGKVVVCFDIADRIANANEDGEYKFAVQGFLNWIDDCNKYYGLGITSDDIEVDVIPGTESDVATRSAALQRIRTEIMAGKGPDIFICNSFSAGGFPGEELYSMDGGRLFPYVEKSRDEGIFLPLDEMLDDLTLTDVNDWIPQLMEGGKNKDGEQVIIPLSFNVPGVIFSGDSSTNFYGENLPEVNFEGTSWDDVLRGDDPILSELSVCAMNYYRFNEDRTRTGAHPSGLYCLMPQTADFENETPAFSEEELFELVKDSMAGYRSAMDREPAQYSSSLLFNPYNLIGFNALFLPDHGRKPYALVPMRNLEGGTTASVTHYCAVNANTRKKDKVAKVLDAFLAKDYQKGASLYGFFNGMPNSRTLMSPGNKYLKSESEFDAQKFAQWQRIYEDINIVRFPNALDAELDAMMMDIEDSMYTYRHPASGNIMRDGQFLQGSLSDEELKEIVSKHYKEMQKLMDES